MTGRRDRAQQRYSDALASTAALLAEVRAECTVAPAPDIEARHIEAMTLELLYRAHSERTVTHTRARNRVAIAGIAVLASITSVAGLGAAGALPNQIRRLASTIEHTIIGTPDVPHRATEARPPATPMPPVPRASAKPSPKPPLMTVLHAGMSAAHRSTSAGSSADHPGIAVAPRATAPATVLTVMRTPTHPVTPAHGRPATKSRGKSSRHISRASQQAHAVHALLVAARGDPKTRVALEMTRRGRDIRMQVGAPHGAPTLARMVHHVP